MQSIVIAQFGCYLFCKSHIYKLKKKLSPRFSVHMHLQTLLGEISRTTLSGVLLTTFDVSGNAVKHNLLIVICLLNGSKTVENPEK